MNESFTFQHIYIFTCEINRYIRHCYRVHLGIKLRFALYSDTQGGKRIWIQKAQGHHKLPFLMTSTTIRIHKIYFDIYINPANNYIVQGYCISSTQASLFQIYTRFSQEKSGFYFFAPCHNQHNAERNQNSFLNVFLLCVQLFL